MCMSRSSPPPAPKPPPPPVAPPPVLEQIVPERAEDQTVAKKQKKKSVGTKKYQTALSINKSGSGTDGSGINTPVQTMCMGGGTAYAEPEDEPRTDTTYASLDKIPVESIDRTKDKSAAPQSITKPKKTATTTKTPLNIA